MLQNHYRAVFRSVYPASWSKSAYWKAKKTESIVLSTRLACFDVVRPRLASTQFSSPGLKELLSGHRSTKGRLVNNLHIEKPRKQNPLSCP